MTKDRDSIIREIDISAPIEKVWATVTDARHVGEWFTDNGASIDFRVGGAMKLDWKEWGVSWGQIEEIDAPYRFVWRWGSQNEKKLVAGNSTLVEFVLESIETGTRLRIVDSGFASMDISPEQQASRLADNTSGWSEISKGIKTYAESIAA
ncbi:MAG: SRPBCC domain-containing protein [Thermomicrobiales bacterium]